MKQDEKAQSQKEDTPMKKILIFSLVFIFAFSNVPVFAQMPVSVSGVMPAAGLERIGVIAATKGVVELVTPGQAGRIASSGQEVFMGDEVKTDAQGHLQILLLDQTVFTIGPNSAIIIDKFVYDPGTETGKIEASVTKGVFRYVSGKIAAKDPDSVSLNLPSATLGFRGTIVAGQVNTDGSSMAALLGPGQNNDAGATIGAFEIKGTGDNAGESQMVTRPDFGVRVGAEGNLSGVFQLSAAEVHGLTAGLLPSAGQDNRGDRSGPGEPQADQQGQPGGTEGPRQSGPLSPAGQALLGRIADKMNLAGSESGTILPAGTMPNLGDKSMTAMSGEMGAIANRMGIAFDSFNKVATDLGILSTTSAQYAATAANTIIHNAATDQKLGNITNKFEVDHVTNVTSDYYFSKSGVNLYAPGTQTTIGSYDISFGIDFEGQTIGGGSVEVTYNDTRPTTPVTRNLTFIFADPTPFKDASAAALQAFNLPLATSEELLRFKLDVDLTLLNTAGGAVGSIAETANTLHQVVTLKEQVVITPGDPPITELQNVATGSGDAPRLISG